MLFLGVPILFGLVLGTAQALVLWRYFKEATGPWIAASFAGWIAGWLVFLFVRLLADLVGWLEVDQQTGSPSFGPDMFGPLMVWVVFTASQGAALALVAFVFGRRSVLPLAALWPLAGSLGGTLATFASYSLTDKTTLQSGTGLFLDEFVALIPGQTAAGALYGAATGVVFAMIARRSAAEDRRRPEHRRLRLSCITAGLAALLVLVVVGSWGVYASTVTCTAGVRTAIEEFPQYGNQQIQPERTPLGRCGVRFSTADPEEDVFTYYVERLQEHGWEVTRVPESVSNLADLTGSEETLPMGASSSSLGADRSGYSYGVSYHTRRGSEEASVSVWVVE